MPTGTVLFGAGAAIDSVYFLEEGVATIMAGLDGGKQSCVAIIGREGYLVPAALLGKDTVANRCEMVVAGRGRRIGLDYFREVIGREVREQNIMLGFTYTLIAQMMATLLSQSATSVDRRLARLILMIHDRSSSDDLPLMHDRCAIMLGVRRPSVTTAMHILQGAQLIHNERGFVTVTNRLALQDYAASSYGRAEAEYNRTIAPFF